MKLIFATSNPHKFQYGYEQMRLQGIELVQKSVDIVEIQSERVEEIARHKAKTAFEMFKKPVIVNDASWSISALSGFPGPYMSSVETWFSTEDFLRLMHGLQDREIVLTEILVFTDGKQTKVFEDSLQGIILNQAQGETDFKSLDPIVSFRSDGKSLSQARRAGLPVSDQDFTNWDEFAAWYKQRSR